MQEITTTLRPSDEPDASEPRGSESRGSERRGTARCRVASLRTSTGAALVLVASLLSVACNQATDAQEWQPGDHDGDAKAGQVDGVAAPGQEDQVIVSMAWKQNCARCHGLDGHGNTPEGRMNKVPDITASKASDDELLTLIAKGRNKMPAFGEALPPKVVQGLVGYVRGLGGRGPKQ